MKWPIPVEFTKNILTENTVVYMKLPLMEGGYSGSYYPLDLFFNVEENQNVSSHFNSNWNLSSGWNDLIGMKTNVETSKFPMRLKS